LSFCQPFLSARGSEKAMSASVGASKGMSKRIDFAKERRDQGRSLSGAVRELAALIRPLANQQGIDLQARLDEASGRRSEEQRQLAERLQESVVPLFIADSSGRPDRIGSCVLVRLNSRLFAFTAAHVGQEWKVASAAALHSPSDLLRKL